MGFLVFWGLAVFDEIIIGKVFRNVGLATVKSPRMVRIADGRSWIGVKALRKMLARASQNRSRQVWVLKMDIRRFYDKVDHAVLMRPLARVIRQSDLLELVRTIVEDFTTPNITGKGLPLGNVTSQLFSNVYLTPLDRFLKLEMRER